MTRFAYGNVADRILLLLAEEGPLTRVEIERHLGNIDKNTAGSVISRLNRIVKRGPNVGERRVHVCGWQHYSDVSRNYLRPVYALGHGENKARPSAKCMLKVKREYWARRKQRNEMFAPGSDLQRAWNAQ